MAMKAILKGGKALMSKLEEIAQKMQGTVKVGFMNGATYALDEGGELVAAVAAENEYGVPAKNQPPRPFFRRMIAKESPQWGNMIAKKAPYYRYDGQKTMLAMGKELEEELRQSIRDLIEPPLSPTTIRLREEKYASKRKRKKQIFAKGSGMGIEKPLIFTGKMIGSISSEVE